MPKIPSSSASSSPSNMQSAGHFYVGNKNRLKLPFKLQEDWYNIFKERIKIIVCNYLLYIFLSFLIFH